MTTVNKDPRDIILKPVVSEKSYSLIDEGKYTFLVDPRASKTEIKLAIEKIFGVKVASVNTINRVGKARRTRFGRYIFATGGNPDAASLSGIGSTLISTDTNRLPGV